MPSAYAQPGTDTSSSASSSCPPKPPIVSSGRGGSGNIRPKSVLTLDLFDEAEILQKRRLEASLNPRVKIKYTGRGGSGNIRAASVAQSIPFDISADPDDEYEQIVLQGAQKAKKDKTPSTGRGGLGNFNRPRAKSFVAANTASKGKKDKARRRRSNTSSRFSTSTTNSGEHHELQRICTDTASLSLSIPASMSTPTSSPSSLFGTSLRSSSSPSLSSAHSSGHYSLPTRMTISATPAPILSQRPTPRSSSSSSLYLLPTRVPTTVVSAPSSPVLPNPRSSPSLSSLPARASTSTLGLLSPPASPISPEASPNFSGPGTPPCVEKRLSDSRRDSSEASNTESARISPVPHKLHKARSHDTTKWWKMGGRRRIKDSVVHSQDVASNESVVPSRDVAPTETMVPSQDIPPETHSRETMAHLQEVGMHAMEVRMRMREERLSIRNSLRHAPNQESDQHPESVFDDEHDLPVPRDIYTLASVPEEESNFVSFLDFS